MIIATAISRDVIVGGWETILRKMDNYGCEDFGFFLFCIFVDPYDVCCFDLCVYLVCSMQLTVLPVYAALAVSSCLCRAVRLGNNVICGHDDIMI